MGYKYMIHTCNQRRWYVNKFLIPSMLEQGIKKDEIIVAVDSNNSGILISTMQMFDWIGRTQDWSEVMWHLQDDVIISSDFAKRTKELYGDVVCGFCSKYDESKKYGPVDREQMWYSFPCIGIKNFLAKECAEWFFENAVYNSKYKSMIASRKYVDTFFRYFVQQYSKLVKVFNCKPNLVDHVDYLLGGSIVNQQRPESQIRAWYWDEGDRVKTLQNCIEKMVVRGD